MDVGARSRTRRAWTIVDVPDQSGRTAVITGANVGLGLESARALASRGASVILACRDISSGQAAAQMIATQGTVKLGKPDVIRLDLASLASIREAAAQITSSYSRLDLLINNAGVMCIPFDQTDDGFERTIATNHFGHFALTGLVLERLIATPGSRVITVSSNAHRRAQLDFDDLGSQRHYDPSRAYDASKLANLLFAYALQKRLDAASVQTISLAAHPGNVRTGLWRTSSRLERMFISSWLRPLNSWLAQSPADGALPILRAAVDSTARGGDYYGPAGWFEYVGRPELVESSPASHDAAAQSRLWRASEQLTGVRYPLPDL
jgi:NAD(P)-dependent dehydrogenase (short-subunit alcohol dehydrogenase family)